MSNTTNTKDVDFEFEVEEVEQVIAPIFYSNDLDDGSDFRPSRRHCDTCSC
ncbi:MAG: hypothetical protein JNN15_02045 [Blastocatellia bacterium]|nr:hypothetical protein [Blastocatellia bacterium]